MQNRNLFYIIGVIPPQGEASEFSHYFQNKHILPCNIHPVENIPQNHTNNLLLSGNNHTLI